MTSETLTSNIMQIEQPTEADALHLLDEAKKALEEIKDMQFEDFPSEDIETESPNDSDMKDAQTNSEAELIELSHIILRSLPKEQEEKKHTKLSIAENNALIKPPSPTPVTEVVQRDTTTSPENQPVQEIRKRWSALKRIFSRNKSTKI